MMERNLSRMSQDLFDLLVIGGGIYGVSIARDAALRGLHVALVEKVDFGHATSFNSLKVVHGGFRYLQHLNIKRMRESIAERSILMRIAPHLVRPLSFLMPTYGHGLKGKEIMRIALMLNDLIGFDRNNQVHEQCQLPNGYVIPKSECLRLVPGLHEEGLTGGAIWFDGQLQNSERLIMGVLKSAVSAGAEVANYVEVTGLMKRQDVVCGVHVEDRLTEEQFDIQAKMVVNASGPWVSEVLGLSSRESREPQQPLSKAMNLVVKRSITNQYAVGVSTRQEYRDSQAVFHKGSRLYFMVPWRGYTFIGTTHTYYGKTASQFQISEEDVQDFLDDFNSAYSPANLQRDDLCFVYAGLLPRSECAVGSQDVSLLKRPRIIDHEHQDHIKGLVSVIGVKLTEARYVAEQVIDLVSQKLGQTLRTSQTAILPIDGGEVSSGETSTYLTQLYGSASDRVWKYVNEHSEFGDRVCANSPVIKAEIVHAVREEMALTLGDIVRRRTELGTFESPGAQVLRTAAALAADELNWSPERQEAEVTQLMSTYATRFPWSQVQGNSTSVESLVGALSR